MKKTMTKKEMLLKENGDLLKQMNAMELLQFAKEKGWTATARKWTEFKDVVLGINNSDLQLITKGRLKEFGLTRREADSIEPDWELPNPHYKTGTVTMKLYLVEKIKNFNN